MVFTQNVHPICLPVESNENAEKWKDEEVIVLGFASNDNTYGSLKKAEMSVHTQNKCNDILAEKRKSKNEYWSHMNDPKLLENSKLALMCFSDD